MDTNHDRLMGLLEDHFGWTNIAPETTLKELGADSLDVADLEYQIDVEFDVEVELDLNHTVEQILSLLWLFLLLGFVGTIALVCGLLKYLNFLSS